ncbi:unnamed protein product [Colias eurytheme]|nr:unnamed protein product [Colias eurytheme]
MSIFFIFQDDPGPPNNDDTQRPRSASQSLMSEDRPDSRSTTQSEMETRPRSQVGIGPMSTTEEESNTSHSSRNLTYQRFARRERNAVSTTTNDSVTAALQRLEQISSNINNPPHFDEFHYFGLNVASQLRALPLNLALDVQAEIQTSLLSARRRQLYPNIGSVSIPTMYTPNQPIVIQDNPANSQNVQPLPSFGQASIQGTSEYTQYSSNIQNQDSFSLLRRTSMQGTSEGTADVLSKAWDMS